MDNIVLSTSTNSLFEFMSALHDEQSLGESDIHTINLESVDLHEDYRRSTMDTIAVANTSEYLSSVDLETQEVAATVPPPPPHEPNINPSVIETTREIIFKNKFLSYVVRSCIFCMVISPAIAAFTLYAIDRIK